LDLIEDQVHVRRAGVFTAAVGAPDAIEPGKLHPRSQQIGVACKCVAALRLDALPSAEVLRNLGVGGVSKAARDGVIVSRGRSVGGCRSLSPGGYWAKWRADAPQQL